MLNELSNQLTDIDHSLSKVLDLGHESLKEAIEALLRDYRDYVVATLQVEGGKELVRQRKHQLIYLLERLEDLERGDQDRTQHLRLMDAGLSFLEQPIKDVDNPDVVVRGQALEVQDTNYKKSPLIL